MAKESRFEAHVIDRLNLDFPGCFIIKNDSGHIQGIPDRTVFFGEKWAWLEIKDSARAAQRPNQAYYIELGQKMSFAFFIYPENEEEVFDALQQAFNPRRSSRLPQRQ